MVHAPLFDTNVRREGVGSVTVVLTASPGPTFTIVMLYVMLVPGLAVDGPLFAIERSAFCSTVAAVADELLLDGTGSVVPALAVAVLVIEAGGEPATV